MKVSKCTERAVKMAFHSALFRDEKVIGINRQWIKLEPSKNA